MYYVLILDTDEIGEVEELIFCQGSHRHPYRDEICSYSYQCDGYSRVIEECRYCPHELLILERSNYDD